MKIEMDKMDDLAKNHKKLQLEMNQVLNLMYSSHD